MHAEKNQQESVTRSPPAPASTLTLPASPQQFQEYPEEMYFVSVGRDSEHPWLLRLRSNHHRRKVDQASWRSTAPWCSLTSCPWTGRGTGRLVHWSPDLLGPVISSSRQSLITSWRRWICGECNCYSFSWRILFAACAICHSAVCSLCIHLW